MREITITRILIGLLFVAILVGDVAIWRGQNYTVLFTIPLAIAALRATSRDVVVTAAFALLVDFSDVLAFGFPGRWPLTVGALIVVSYLSLRLVAERQRALKQVDVAEAARKQSQLFLGMISHDLRTPLTVIFGRAQLLRRDLERGNQVAAQRDGQIIESAAQRMRRLVEDLLVAARLGAGRFEIHPIAMDLAECVRQVVAEQQPTLTAQHHFVLEVPTNLRGSWDPERIGQMLTNLISNAVKYSPHGEAVGICLRHVNGSAEIVVRDKGIGITPERMSQLFQPFVRFEPERPVGGTGLGLYITKGIVEAHGGHIRAESTPGHGTAFFITLPMKRASTGDRAA